MRAHSDPDRSLLTLVTQSIGEFLILLALGVGLVGGTTVMLANYNSYATRYLRYVLSWYDRRGSQGFRPRGTERQRLIGLRLACIIGLAMGIFVLVVEISALASGHVS